MVSWSRRISSPYLKGLKMKTFKIEIILDVDDYTTNIGWITEAIKEQLEDGECLVSARFQDLTDGQAQGGRE